MRTSFGLACMAMAAQTYAFDWNIVKHAVLTSSLGEDYEQHPVYQFHGTNRSTARKNMEKHSDRKVADLSK